MESKYTKGPWKITENSIDQDAITDSEMTKAVCFVPSNDDESEANARLIAAAPELLEALIKCQPYMIDLQVENFNDPTVGFKEDPALTEAVILLAQAIKKATSI